MAEGGVTANSFPYGGMNRTRPWAWVALAVLTMAVMACGGSGNSAASNTPSSAPTPDSTARPDGREPASASINGGPTAVAGDPAYEEWATAVCAVLDSALLQPETVSVSAGDLAAFFHGATTSSQDVASKLEGIDAAAGTEAFMRAAQSTFEDLAPILSETADLLDATAGTPEASGADATDDLRQLLDKQETQINQVLSGLRRAAGDLPPEALNTLLNHLSCGAIRRQ